MSRSPSAFESFSEPPGKHSTALSEGRTTLRSHVDRASSFSLTSHSTNTLLRIFPSIRLLTAGTGAQSRPREVYRKVMRAKLRRPLGLMCWCSSLRQCSFLTSVPEVKATSSHASSYQACGSAEELVIRVVRCAATIRDSSSSHSKVT